MFYDSDGDDCGAAAVQPRKSAKCSKKKTVYNAVDSDSDDDRQTIHMNEELPPSPPRDLVMSPPSVVHSTHRAEIQHTPVSRGKYMSYFILGCLHFLYRALCNLNT